MGHLNALENRHQNSSGSYSNSRMQGFTSSYSKFEFFEYSLDALAAIPRGTPRALIPSSEKHHPHHEVKCGRRRASLRTAAAPQCMRARELRFRDFRVFFFDLECFDSWATKKPPVGNLCVEWRHRHLLSPRNTSPKEGV